MEIPVWKVAVNVGGIGAVGLFLFSSVVYGLYKLKIFPRLIVNTVSSNEIEMPPITEELVKSF